MARTLSRRGLGRKLQRQQGSRHGLEGMARLAPGGDPAPERTRSPESHLDEQERRPGARHFVGSIAGEDDLPFARDSFRPAGQIVARHAVRAADGLASGRELAAQIDHQGRILGAEAGNQLGGLDGELAEQPQDGGAAPPSRLVPAEVAEPRGDNGEPEGRRGGKAAAPRQDPRREQERYARNRDAELRRERGGKKHQISMLEKEAGHRAFDAARPFWVLGPSSPRRCSSKNAKTRCQSRTCREGSARMWVIPASGRKSNGLPARKSASASRSDSLKWTLSSAVPCTMRSGFFR